MTATIISDDFNRAIAATKGFLPAEKHPANPARKYIRLEFSKEAGCMTAMAVDGHRMSVEHAKCRCDEDFTAYIHGHVKLPPKMDASIELNGKDVLIRCGGFIFGCPQPKVNDLFRWEDVLPGEPSFVIGFNGDYLLSALQAAKISAGKSFRAPVVLEFRGPLSPVILRTNKNDIKMVLPVRIKA